jgi:hypothetical protein
MSGFADVAGNGAAIDMPMAARAAARKPKPFLIVETLHRWFDFPDVRLPYDICIKGESGGG